MNVVVPMAGKGSRYAEKGFNIPKPLIPILGKEMLFWALKSLEGVAYKKIIFIALEEHERQYNLRQLISNNFHSSFELVLIESVTEGQLCTVLAAKNLFDMDDDLLVISSDTLISGPIGNDILTKDTDTEGIISVINLPGKMWSFAKTDEQGNVIQVAEKVRISDNASTGIYYFSNAGKFVSEAEKIVATQEKTKGEYYIIPVYQKLIEKKEKVKLSHATQMWDMGTPEAKTIFEKHLAK